MKRYFIAVVMVAALFWGCASAPVQHYFSMPETQTATLNRIKMTMAPFKEDTVYFVGFDLTIQNTGSQAVELDWNHCRYLHRGQDMGLLLFPGIDPKTVQTNIPSETIPAGQTFTQKVYPFRTITVLTGAEVLAKGRGGFKGGILPLGQNSLLLVFNQSGAQSQQVLSVRLRAETVDSQ